jgi:hypothetical protein
VAKTLLVILFFFLRKKMSWGLGTAALLRSLRLFPTSVIVAVGLAAATMVVLFCSWAQQHDDDDKQERKRRLVILDLDDVLVQRVLTDFPSTPPSVSDGDDDDSGTRSAVVGNYRVWLRPHVRGFLRRLFEHYDVALWTSRTKHNVARLTDYVFGAYRPRLVFEYHAEQGNVTYEELEERFPPYRRPDIVFVSPSRLPFAGVVQRERECVRIPTWTPEDCATDCYLDPSASGPGTIWDAL